MEEAEEGLVRLTSQVDLREHLREVSHSQCMDTALQYIWSQEPSELTGWSQELQKHALWSQDSCSEVKVWSQDCCSDVKVWSRDGYCSIPVLVLAAGSTFLKGLLDEVQDPMLVLPDFRLHQTRSTLVGILEENYTPDPELFNLLFPSCLRAPIPRSNKDDHAEPTGGDLRVEDDTVALDEDLSLGCEEEEEGGEDVNLVLMSPEEAEPLVAKHLNYEGSSNMFSCLYCQGQFASKNKKTVSTHILRHLKLFIYKCEVCDKKFRQSCNHRRHIKSHTKLRRRVKVRAEEGGGPHVTQSAQLSNHTELDVPDVTALSLEQLHGKLISFQQGLDLIKDIIVKEKNIYRCGKCGKDCGRIVGNCRDHIWRTHFHVFLYKCDHDTCGRKFRKLTDFKDHVKQHEEKASILRSLEDRNETNLDSNSSFHLLTKPLDVSKERGFEIASLYFYHDPVLRKYKCKLCEYCHNRLQGVRNHVLANHLTQIYLFMCPHCSKRFRYENQYKLHVSVHQEGKYVCSKCGKQLVTRRYLLQHEKTAHGVQEIHCQESGCKYRGKNSLQMDRHRKVYHEADRSDWHFCEICAKPFPYIHDLKVHLARCEAGKSMAFKKLRLNKYILKQGEEDHYCLICNVQSKSYRGMTEHLKRYHDIFESRNKEIFQK